MSEEEKIKELEILFQDYMKELKEIENQANEVLKIYLKKVQQKKINDLQAKIKNLYEGKS